MERVGDGSVTTLGELAEAYWDAYLLDDPVQGTAIGDRRYNDRLPDITPAGRHYIARRYEGLRERLEALPPDAADPESHLTRSALLSAIGSRLAFLGAEATSYTVDAMIGPQNAFMSIPGFQPLDDPADGAAMLSRWRAMGPWLDDLISSLRDGLANGRAPVAGSVRRVLDQAHVPVRHDLPVQR